MTSTVCVFGASGFVGTALTMALAEAGSHVLALVREPGDSPHENVEFISGSFATPKDFAAVLQRCTAVVHLASLSTPAASAGRPLMELTGNLAPTFALLEALQEWPDRHLVFVSSGGTLYGDAGAEPINETGFIRPKSYYGAGKAAAEHFISAWASQVDGSATIIRPTNLYGPGQLSRRGFGIVPAAFECALRSRPLTIWGDGSVVRDYLFIDDFIRLCLRVLAGPRQEKGAHLLNASSGRGTSVDELLDVVEKVVEKGLDRRYDVRRSVDVSRIVLDPTRAFRSYGWQADTDLEAGLRSTWDWYRRSS